MTRTISENRHDVSDAIAIVDRAKVAIAKLEQLKQDSYRPSCSECLEKHLGAAMVLLGEAETDYPEHKLLAVGHLHEAEEESREAWPHISMAVREARKQLQQTGEPPDFYMLAQLLREEDNEPDVPVVVVIDRMDAAGVMHLEIRADSEKSKRRAKVRKVIREYKEGKLSIGKSDKQVQDERQALAIALNAKLDSLVRGRPKICDRSARLDALRVQLAQLREDRNCLKPDDKDSAGRRCGKRARAATGKLTSVNASGKKVIDKAKAKKLAADIRKAKYGAAGSPQQQGKGSAAPTTAPTAKAKVAAKRKGKVSAKPASSPIKTNQKELDKSRADLEKRFGKKTVEAAEKNVKKIMDDPDTNIYVRAGSAATLEKIIGDRFKTSAELGIDSHQIPHLADGYQKARNRVEEKTLGYDSKNTKPEDRPIYGYMGGKDPDGASHRDVADAYGSIALKLKPEVKDRATFTAADSFKSGIASQIKNDGTPPPPNAASLVASTRHGYDIDKLPKHYPSYYNDDSIHGSQLKNAAKAKSIDDLATVGAPTGNRYVEAQIHGKVTAQDIAEIAFTPKGVADRPTPAIAQFAKDNGVPLLVNGKKLSDDELDNIITPPADKRSKTLQDLSTALDKAIKDEDFDAVMPLAEKIAAKADKVKLQPGERDKQLKMLYAEAGYDGLPKVATSTDIDKIYADGGLLMVRGVAKASSGDPNQYLKDFQSGDYFVGKGIYGDGTYVGHSGRIDKGKFVYKAKASASAQKDAKDAVNHVSRNGYMDATTVNFRMAADPKDFKIITQTQLLNEREEMNQKIFNWATPKRQQLIGNAKTYTKTEVAALKRKVTAEKNKYDDTQLQVTKTNRRTIGAFSVEDQTWSFPSKKGSGALDIKVKKESSKLFGSTEYKILDDKGQVIDTIYAQSNQTKPDKATIQTAISLMAERKALAQTGLNAIPKVGDLNDPAVAKKVADFDAQVRRMQSILGGDEGHLGNQGTISNLAVIRGYDAVALDQSYEPTTFMNLLNRSKVYIQDDPLDWNRAKKTGAA